MKNGTLSREELDSLKSRLDLAQAVQAAGVELKARGKSLFGRCPFHEDGDASLSIKPETQLFKCFGCQAAGDVFRFFELMEGSFPRALARVQALAGELPPPPPPNGQSKNHDQSEDFLPGGLTRPQVLGRVADLYQTGLRQSREAQEYLEGRGLGRTVWDAFRIGYADGSLAAKVSGPQREALQAVGVLNSKGKEHFRGCVVVPLEHPDLGVVGLYGRRIRAASDVRHLYLPGPRRGVLNWAALKHETVYVTEGIFDALSLWSIGVTETTCLYGLANPSPDLEELLARYGTREVRFCLDSDPAGQQALVRLAVALYGRRIRSLAVELPGKDPNELLVATGPDGLRQALLNVVPIDAPELVFEAESRPVERSDKGFLMRFGALTYEVIPLRPYGDRLKVSLKATLDGKTFRDSFDMGAQKGRVQAINPLSRHLAVPKLEIERQFSALLEETERWVADQLDDGSQDLEAAPYEMSEAERAAALEYLRQADLVPAILRDTEELGYVGEPRGKLLAYLIAISRKLESPLSGVVVSQSGAGKSQLTELIVSMSPPEDVLHFTRLTAQALSYMQKDFRHKLLLIEERAGGEAADYQMRVLLSRGRLDTATVVKDPNSGKMQTVNVHVEGPVASLETTTNPHMNHENATRLFEIYLDESEEQTRRIHERQRLRRRFDPTRRPDRRREEIRQLHQNAQRLLEPIVVFIPYVDELTFPSRWLRTRRDHERFLSLIETSAFLHQHQREGGRFEDGDGRYVLAAVEDYRNAYELATEVLEALFDELSRDARELLARATEMLARSGRPDFTRRELRQWTDWQDHRLRAAVKELVEMEYLVVMSGTQGQTYRYQLVADPGLAQGASRGRLLHPEELARKLGAG